MNDLNSPKLKSFEYEERAFLEEADVPRVKQALEAQALKVAADNKTSYFFVLPDVNISIAASAQKTVLKYKGGQIGKGNGFEEYDVAIDPGSLRSAIAFMTSLLHVQPQISEQFRINYDLGEGIEVALKYTQTWGFHLEAEKVYSADPSDSNAMDLAKEQAKHDVEEVAEKLGIRFMTKDEVDTFVAAHKAGNIRGAYTPDEFRKKFADVFSTPR